MSDVTLSAAVRSSLLSLQSTADLVDRTNGRLSTGLRVSSVVDDPVSFFSARSLSDRAFDFEERKGGIDQGISTLSSALEGVEGIDSLVRQLKGIANSLKSAKGAQFTDLSAQFNNVRSQIGELAADTDYQGINLIDQTTETLTVYFSNTTTAKLTVDATNLREEGLGVKGLEARADSKISFSAGAGVSSGYRIDAGTGVVALTAATSMAAFGGSISVTYNGTGTTITSAGEITFALNTAVSVTVRVATGESVALTQGQTLTLQLTTKAEGFAAYTQISVGDQFLGVVDGNAGALGANSQEVRIGTLGAYQSGAAFIAEGQSDDIENLITELDATLATLRSEGQKLGSNVALLTTRLDFTEAYVNVLEEGSGKLTLADLNSEGANLLALQTRQQLGISALAFAGQSEQGILALFN